MIKVSILGTGNVATHLFRAFSNSAEIEIVQVIGRNKEALQAFGTEEKTTTDFSRLKFSDIYIVALSDSSISTVSQEITINNSLIVHSSGNTPMSALSTHQRRGVFYPLQTFSRSNELDFKNVPVCLEANEEADLALLKKLAHLVSENVYEISTEQRKSLHLAAVFTNNFTNYMYHVGSEICKENNVPFEILSPLIQETAEKIKSLSPFDAQTGPARRRDHNTISNHLEQLNNTEYKAVYELLSKSIEKTYGKEL
ncbi:Rossmann-like and DUF2520 domain-containing protein [uncultured Zobellia sp.]|uniref:Rossmann-like and DUF2520 domain-containing protein n=1 Tax=uncultured Zobellia sp. TaxID=255433 RepID=UPI00259ADCF4|nr:Rossmann-like and DUF2520 domain-containing protein [uncultured Zobellia sp.]